MLTPNKIITPPITSVLLNGRPLADYSVVVPDREQYAETLTYVTRFLKIYCGVTLPVKQNGEPRTGPEILLGSTDRTPERAYSGLETEITRLGEDLLLGACGKTAAAMVFDRFLMKYLDRAGEVRIDLPEGEPVYKNDRLDFEGAPSLFSVQDRIVRSMLKLQAMLEADYLDGLFFSYQHHGYKSTMQEARETGRRVTNCVIVMNWVLKDAGVYEHGTFNHLYNGTVGYQVGNGELKEAMTGGNFDIIETEKTIAELGDEGNLYPGDIIFFRDYHADHNQIVFDRTHAIDGGRGNCFVVEVGAPFRRFLGNNNCMKARVGLIFRSVDAQ